MIRNTLFSCVALGLYASAALAQDTVAYDDRFYVAPSIGVVFTDSKRNAENSPILGFGFGRMLTSNFSLEADVNRFDADLEDGSGSWEVTGFGLAGRLFFGQPDSWRPFAMIGLGTQRSDRDGFNVNRLRPSRSSNGFDFRAGFGWQSNFTDRVSGRVEAVYRYMQDPDSLPRDDDFQDWIANFGLAIALGERSSMAMVSEEAENLGTPDAARMDEPMDEATDEPMDDSAAEPMADEPPVASEDMQEVIDLRGVNFDFDKCNLRSDAVAILDNAVDVLKSNDLTVSVEGHTDAIGSDAYNQTLSECRARVVHEYLTTNGVSGGKLSGSVGWGESKPIDTNDTVEGRANNRRTELVRKN